MSDRTVNGAHSMADVYHVAGPWRDNLKDAFWDLGRVLIWTYWVVNNNVGVKIVKETCNVCGKYSYRYSYRLKGKTCQKTSNT